MKGCIEEIFKRYNLSVLVMSQREVRKRRVLSWVAGSEEGGVFSWVTGWAESPPVCWGLRRNGVLMNAVLSWLILCFLSL